MPRTVEIGENELVVHFSGLLYYETLTATFRIPYGCIRSLTTVPFTPPEGTVQSFGTRIPFTDIREGRFLHGDEWYFLSYEHREKAVTVELVHYHHGDHPEPYRLVVIGADEPETLRTAIEAAWRRAVPSASG